MNSVKTPMIIAEVGSNWKTFEDCQQSIKLAKECGADAVKFQLFSEAELYGPEYPRDRGQLPLIEPLAQLASFAYDIEFMCTGFSPEGYDRINPWVKRHKIASAEITDLNILDRVNSYKKPVLLSTGGASVEQIQVALEMLNDCDVTPMFCVTAYPARVVDFREFQYTKELFPEYKWGYSDHSEDVLNVPWLAKEFGCMAIEKHVNFTDHKDTPDAPHSLNAKEFGQMVRRLRNEDRGDTFTPCTWQRVKTDKGYFRPR